MAVFSASCVIYNGQRPAAYRAGQGRLRLQHGPGLGCGEKHRQRSIWLRRSRAGLYTLLAKRSIPMAGGVPYGMYFRRATLSGEDIRPWFARAGIYALPAVYEPFGLSVLEAALSGCALVLGDIPSLARNLG